MLKSLKAILIALCILLFGFTAVEDDQIRVVVVDAGHGGKDPGAIGAISKEKDVVLDLAFRLEQKIKSEYPDVKVILTRNADKFIELHERSNIANRHKADLFISIHCNSLPKNKTSPAGTETFVMGIHKTDENLEVAKRENAAIYQEKNYEEVYKGFNPNSPLAYIMMANRQNAFMSSSSNFASKIENQFKTHAKRSSRGVKQAGLLVLWQSTMPAVLVEAGFLSHREEEHFLNTEDGQDSIAEAIFLAFKEYKEELEEK
jgi:N-acetylmuramoyl-L-alanine amidase